jgi:hypothetical protein
MLITPRSSAEPSCAVAASGATKAAVASSPAERRRSIKGKLDYSNGGLTGVMLPDEMTSFSFTSWR